METQQSFKNVGDYSAPDISVYFYMRDDILCQSSDATLVDLDVVDYGEI